MEIRNDQLSPTASAHTKSVRGRISSSTSQTQLPFFRHRPGFGFRVLAVRVAGTSVTATITVDAILAGANEIVSAPTLAIDVVPEKFKITTAFRAIANSRWVAKATATALTFSAAHVVSASKFGCILIQMDNAGTVTTKVAAATQAYATAAQALAALPAADSGKVKIGYIAIAAKAATWTANTDDMTDGSDLTTATFNAATVTAPSLLSGAITPVALEVTAGTLLTDLTKIQDRTGLKDIILHYTSDGSGAVTNGEVQVDYRPFPMHGEQY